VTDIALYNAIDSAIAEWLAAKAGTSNSAETASAYRDTMANFRAALRERNADLLDNPALVALTAEQWAVSSRRDKPVSGATFNQRLAIISSFYVYYAKKAILSGQPVINPIQAVERRKVQAYARAQHIDAKEIKRRMKAIDRSTLQGKRDYALLTILSVTGRRLSETAGMTRGDLAFGDTITITFPRCKGGKAMSDRLTAKQSAALVAWLQAYHGTDLASLPNEQPVWLSLSKRNHGAALGIQSIADVCEKVLGTSKVHTLRHSFAVMMEQSGASLTEIQNRLGHESAATTSIYMERLHSAENPYSGKIDDLLGTWD
jgi:site-specific recombinase XerD